MKLICGVGVNDSNYKTSKEIIVAGKRKMVWVCPFYLKWKSMITRCYSPKSITLKPTYEVCSVAPEWHYFMTFRAWMETQDWEGKSLDKDILFPGNKIYGPETCVFIDQRVNTFLTDSKAARGEWPIGVSFNKVKLKFEAYGYDSASLRRKYLGSFNCPDEAHKTWLSHKILQAHALAAQQKDERVATALINRYENYHQF